MRLTHIVAYIFAVFAFLTIGSLMMIVSLNVLTMEDALLKVQDVYENSWQLFKTGSGGVIFILIGLVFAKLLVKETRSNEDVLLLGKWGYFSVSTRAIEDLISKALRRFDDIQELQTKIDVRGSQLKVATDISIVTGRNVAEVVDEAQRELLRKIHRLIGDGVEVEVSVNIAKIVEAPLVGVGA
jgi:UDP-N-acetylmuramyl pentapeptide phosphotransferase/UDP-N-acetylglucosamine-1-phosphate transferase